MIISSFDRTTLKLLVAAFLVLGGASFATARAQDGRGLVTCSPDTCPPVYIGSRSEADSAPLPLSISEWNNAFAVSGSEQENNSWLAGGGASVFSSDTDTSDWTAAGSPNAVDGPMSAASLAAHPTCVVYDNGQRALIQGAALHDDAAPVALMVSDRIGGSSLHATTTGDGGFFSLDVAVPYGAIAVNVAVAGQPDAMAACTNPNNGVTMIGSGAVSVSNSAYGRNSEVTP